MAKTLQANARETGLDEQTRGTGDRIGGKMETESWGIQEID